MLYGLNQGNNYDFNPTFSPVEVTMRREWGAEGMGRGRKKEFRQGNGGKSYYSQVRTAKAVMQIFRSGKERPRRLAGGKSRGLDAARAEKMLTESLG